MSRYRYLQSRNLQIQAERAERLAKTVDDKLTVERLLSYAAECRAHAADTDNRPR